MEDTQLTSLTTMTRAVNAGDARGYAAVYAADAVITIHGLGVLEGRDAIEQHEVELLRQFPGTQLAFYGVWQAVDQAVVHYAVNGATPDGRAMGHEGLLFYRFEASGLIRSERRYMDALTPMAQLGMPGVSGARPCPALPLKRLEYKSRGSSVEAGNLARVRSSLAALDANDERAFLSTLAEDLVLDELILPRPLYGRAGAASWLEDWKGAFPDAAGEMTFALAAGDHVLAETGLSGARRGPFGPLPGSNESFTVHRAIMARLNQGQIEHLTFFMNGREFR